jgi:hypothetical protein
MTDDLVVVYVQATARLLEIPMTPERALRVADHLGRTLQMYQLLESVPLDVDVELPQGFVPAPFPDMDTEHA